MLTFEIPNKQLERLAEAVRRAGKKLPVEASAAVNATSKSVRTAMSREIRDEIAAKAKAVNKTLKQTRRAKKTDTLAVVTLAKTNRIPLRDFGAKQNKSGVSYRISKRSGRKTVQGAFQGPRPGLMKNVFKRVGKSRLPIRKLRGPSPWGVFTKRKMSPAIIKKADQELRKQLERRIKLNILRASGAI